MNFSVLMSVYAKERPDYLNSSLNSIGFQSLRASEVILVHDGLLGAELLEVIDKYVLELNIKNVCLIKNMGLAAALNEGLKYCQHDLVIRMDSDDICMPDRFKVQYEFMKNNPDITFSSGYIEEYDDKMENLINVRRLPLEHGDLLKFAKTRSPISHPASIYRKAAVLDVGGYPNIYPEDYALWCLLLARGYKIANIPFCLLKFRAGEGMISRRGFKFLKGYIQTYWLMRKLGSITLLEFAFNVTKQSFVRLSPVFVRKILYKYAR